MARYLPETLDAYSVNVPLLSCSFPVRKGRFNATAFFDGVLPEGQHRATLAARAGVAAQDTFGLLARYGRDVAGALVVVDPSRPEDDRVSGVIELDASPDRHLYLVPSGRVRVNGVEAQARDGVAITGEDKVRIEAEDDAELVLVDTG